MRTLYLLVLLCLPVLAGTAYAQCSNHYYPMKEGAEHEMTVYNRKEKHEGKVINTTVTVEDKDGASYATLHSKIFDKKDKLVSEGDYDIICEGDKMKINMEKLFSSMPQFSNYENATINVNGDYMEMPSQLEVGTTLPDCKSNMTIGEKNTPLISTDMFVKNRKVEKQEEVSTPAGTFTCYKIVYDLEMNMKIMGINRKMINSNAEWVAEGVGVIKTESYDKNGNLESYSLLTAYK